MCCTAMSSAIWQPYMGPGARNGGGGTFVGGDADGGVEVDAPGVPARLDGLSGPGAPAPPVRPAPFTGAAGPHRAAVWGTWKSALRAETTIMPFAPCSRSRWDSTPGLSTVTVKVRSSSAVRGGKVSWMESCRREVRALRVPAPGPERARNQSCLAHAEATLAALTAHSGTEHAVDAHRLAGKVSMLLHDPARAADEFASARVAASGEASTTVRQLLGCAHAEALLASGEGGAALSVLKETGVDAPADEWIELYARAIRTAASHGDASTVDDLVWDMNDEDDTFVVEAAHALHRLEVHGPHARPVIDRALRILIDAGHEEQAQPLRT